MSLYPDICLSHSLATLHGHLIMGIRDLYLCLELSPHGDWKGNRFQGASLACYSPGLNSHYCTWSQRTVKDDSRVQSQKLITDEYAFTDLYFFSLLDLLGYYRSYHHHPVLFS